MKGIIVYKGKYGATTQYAEWVGEELRWPVLVPDNLPAEGLSQFDAVIVGSSVYMGKMLIADWLKKNAKSLKNKTVFLFVVCGTPSSEKEKQQQIVKDNVPAELLNGSNVFFLPGRLIKKGLSWSDRLFLKIGASFEKDPAKKKAMLEDKDSVRKENLTEMMNAILLLASGKNVVDGSYLPVYGSD